MPEGVSRKSSPVLETCLQGFTGKVLWGLGFCVVRDTNSVQPSREGHCFSPKPSHVANVFLSWLELNALWRNLSEEICFRWCHCQQCDQLAIGLLQGQWVCFLLLKTLLHQSWALEAFRDTREICQRYCLLSYALLKVVDTILSVGLGWPTGLTPRITPNELTVGESFNLPQPRLLYL